MIIVSGISEHWLPSAMLQLYWQGGQSFPTLQRHWCWGETPTQRTAEHHSDEECALFPWKKMIMKEKLIMREVRRWPFFILSTCPTHPFIISSMQCFFNFIALVFAYHRTAGINVGCKLIWQLSNPRWACPRIWWSHILHAERNEINWKFKFRSNAVRSGTTAHLTLIKRIWEILQLTWSYLNLLSWL